jgi:hypothetical protein
MKTQYLKAIAISAVLFPSLMLSPVQADSGATEDLQSWNMVTLRAGLGQSKKAQIYLEAQPRVGNLDSSGTKRDDFSTLILRPAVGYQMNQYVSVWQGYAWVPTFQPGSRIENRIFQQLLIENLVKNLKLVNRTRLEERWLEGTNKTAVRFRHMARAAYPLGKSKKWSLVAYDELFINLNSVEHGPNGGFDQNRVFAGVNRQFNKQINAEAGYMNNLVNRKSPTPNHINHIILLTLNFNF